MNESPTDNKIHGAGTKAGPGSLKTLVVNGSVAFVAAHLIVVLIHELSHAVAGLALGYSNRLYPFGVTHLPEAGRADATIMLLTGPAFSLIIGLVAMAVQPFRAGRGFAQLLWLWIAFMSTMEGLGYLLLTPFGVGDTGGAAALFDSPAYVVWPCFILAIAGTFWLAMRFAVPAVRHTAGDLTSLRGFTFFPWIVGTVAVLAATGIDLALAGDSFSGADVFAVLMGSFALGVYAPLAMPFTHRVKKRDPKSEGSEVLLLPQRPVVGIVIVVVILLLNFLVLSRGVPIG